MPTKNRGLGSETYYWDGSKEIPRRKLKVFAVAIDEYCHSIHWTNLEHPIKDCERLIHVLEDRYGAECVHKLYDKDATYDKVRNGILDLTQGGDKELGPEDDLIILFSGHGYHSPQDGGGLVMHDSGDVSQPKVGDRTIRQSWFFEQLRQLSAWQVLLIIDACYGHQFSKIQVDTLPNPGGYPFRSELKPGRWILASSRDREVADYSRFMRGMITLLSGNEEKQLLLAEIIGKLYNRLKVFEQDLPLLKNLVRGDLLSGDFVFYRKIPEPYPERSRAEFLELLRNGSATYLEKLSQGRFRYARIEQLLPGTDFGKPVPTEVEMDKKRKPLLEVVREKRKDAAPHLLLLGNGGMGKTTSLLHLWEGMLRQAAGPIPIFVALNEYNQAGKAARENFLTWYMAKHYLQVPDPDPRLVEGQLWELLKESPTATQPEFLLLLDGFNEVTSDQTELLKELALASRAKNVQIVLTSRYVETKRYTWGQIMEEVQLVPLEEDVIRQYLMDSGLPYPEDKDNRLLSVLSNPMMLAGYAKTEHLAKIYGAEKGRYFFYDAKTESELLWNFNEALLAKALEEQAGPEEREDDIENLWTEYLVRYLVPYLAWRMEKEGQFFISLEWESEMDLSFESIIMDAFGDLQNMEAVFAKSRGKLISAKEREKGVMQILNCLKNELHLLVAEGNHLRFLHQNFRDFYAACHLRNCIRFGLAEEKRPEEWKERTFPIYLRRMIGELEGEYLFDAQEILQGKEIPLRIQMNLLSQLKMACRREEMSDDYTVWNFINILHEVRGTLAGADLRNMDLRGLDLNNIPMTAFRGIKYLPADIDGSKVNGKQFLFQGPSHKVSRLLYSPDGSNIITAFSTGLIMGWSSYSGENKWTLDLKDENILNIFSSPKDQSIFTINKSNDIEEMSTLTGKLLKTFKLHNSHIISANCSPDGQRIVAAFADGTIQEWSAISGKCLRTFKAHSDIIWSAMYRTDSQRILSASSDGTVKEWSISTGLCTIEIRGYSEISSYAVYSPNGQNIIIYAPGDEVFVECSLLTSECSKQFIGHKEGIVSARYSNNGLRVISASRDGEIKEWHSLTGECLSTIEIGHEINNHAEYSPDGLRILSSFSDGTIKEWSLSNGECLKTIQTYGDVVSLSGYRPNRRIISVFKNNSAEEWSFSTRKCIRIFGNYKDNIEFSGYSPDNLHILSFSKRSLQEWSIYNGEVIREIEGNFEGIGTIVYSLDGSQILVASSYEKVIKFPFSEYKRDVIINDEIIKIKHCLFSISPYKMVIGEGDVCINLYYKVNILKNYLVSTGKNSKSVLLKTNKIDGLVNFLAISFANQLVVTSTDNGTIQFWSLSTGEFVMTLEGHSEYVTSAAFSPDGQKLISASEDKTIKEWSVSYGRCISTLEGHSKTVSSILYNHDGNRILSAAWDNTIKEWLISTGECIRTLNVDSGGIASIAYSPDSKWVLYSSFNGNIGEWSSNNGILNQNLTTDTGLYVQSIDFRKLHPDSKFTEEEKERLRRYGAIFDDQDELEWNRAVEDAHGDLDFSERDK